MKRWCPRGIQYWNDMDWKLAWGEAIVAGRHVGGVYVCDNCGAFHLGVPKPIRRTCMTGKDVYETPAAAQESLDRILERKSRTGNPKRNEARIYECLVRGGCGRWHLTSDADRSGRRQEE